jgi:hypothetical protein
MEPQLQKYYENRLSMMGDEAWNDLMDDVREMLAATNRLDGIDSEKALWFKKGEVSIMNWLLSLKDTSEEAYKTIKDEDENVA